MFPETWNNYPVKTATELPDNTNWISSPILWQNIFFEKFRSIFYAMQVLVVNVREKTAWERLSIGCWGSGKETPLPSPSWGTKVISINWPRIVTAVHIINATSHWKDFWLLRKIQYMTTTHILIVCFYFWHLSANNLYSKSPQGTQKPRFALSLMTE